MSPDLAFQACWTAKSSALCRQENIDTEHCNLKSSHFVYTSCLAADARQLSKGLCSDLSFKVVSGAFDMWPTRTLTALASLRGLAEQVQAVKSQMSIYGISAPLSNIMQSQWQQTRGMAVPKRKVCYLALTATSLWRHDLGLPLTPGAIADLPKQKRTQERHEVP